MTISPAPTPISGVDFDAAAHGAQITHVGDLSFRVPSKGVLIATERASGRPKDLADLAALGVAIDE